jgi:UDP-glucose 4-epimerase
MHEIMISDEEAPRVVRRGAYYAIRPMLPEIADTAGEASPMSREFSSADTILDLDRTVALLSKHRLMVGDVILSQTGELLR